MVNPYLLRSAIKIELWYLINSKSNTVVNAGKTATAFSTIISYITELVDIEEIPKIFNNTYNVSIDKDEVCSEFQFYMPNSFDKFSSKMEKALLQAVYNLKLNGKMFDGTFLAHPAMRDRRSYI